MFLTVRRRRHGDTVYEYLDVAESHRVQGKVRRTILWTLGRRDRIDPHRIDALIALLRPLASPEGRTRAGTPAGGPAPAPDA